MAKTRTVKMDQSRRNAAGSEDMFAEDNIHAGNKIGDICAET